METNLSISMLNHTIQLARLIYNILKRTELQLNLTNDVRDGLHTCEQCCLNIIRTCNSYKTLSSSEKDVPITNPVNFDVCDLVQGLLKAFSDTLSSYCETDIKFYPKLRPYTSIRIDQKLFEITVLNILYCFVKNRAPRTSGPLKLTVYVTETYDNITLHIRGRYSDKDKPDSPDLKSELTSKLSSFLCFDDEEFVELSLKLAKWAVSFAQGSLECKNLKNSTRYDITFPKFTGSTTFLSSTCSYRPSREMFTETYSEFNLESLLEKETMLEKLIHILSSMEGLEP